jgi:hypothetical protein
MCIANQAAGSPLIDKAITREQEGKERIGMSILIRIPFTGKKPTIDIVFGKWGNPLLKYCDTCEYLSPKEYQQRTEKVEHRCLHYNGILRHEDYHPKIKKPYYCKIK